MPETLQFDRTEGCFVGITIADCELHPTENILTLTNIFDEEFEGGRTLKFRISSATNPQGARPAGAWAIRSESMFGGVYQVVDGDSQPESFDAKAGVIWSELKVDNLKVFNTETNYIFTITTQHAIPPSGYLKIQLPPELVFDPEKTTKKSLNLLAFVEMTESYITFFFSQGYDTVAGPIQIELSNVRNPRSFRPSEGFIISTMDVNQFVIDQGGQDITVVNN